MVNLFLVFLLICIVLYYVRRKEGFQSGPTMDLVIARYEEDISWIKELGLERFSKIIIYNKGADSELNIPNSEVRRLENYGRESHTYLSHVIENYDSLADITVFLPGSAWYRGDKKERVHRIMSYLDQNKTSIIIGYKDDPHMIMTTNEFSIDNWTVTNEENRKKNPESRLTLSADRPLGKWFEKRFSGEALDCVSFTGILAATREDIHKRSKEFYNSLLEEHKHTNPEVVHYTERLWKNIFSISKDRCMSDSNPY